MTPLSWLASRIALGRRALRRAAFASLVGAILIVVGGGVVRVTASGLGCPDWPSCSNGSLGPTPALGWHGVVEFANRLLTVFLCIAVAAVIVAARLQAQPAPPVTRWAWAQFWIVVVNAVVGGVTVLARLSPYLVAAHFLAAMLLLTVATLTWDKSVQLESPVAPPASASSKTLSRMLLITTGILIVIGTGVTGTGPHAGDSSEVSRMAFDWRDATLAHATVAGAGLVIAAVLCFTARRRGQITMARRSLVYIVVFLSQGTVGVVQSLVGLPEALVALHLLGASLVWIGAIRVATAPELSSECRGRGTRLVRPRRPDV